MLARWGYSLLDLREQNAEKTKFKAIDYLPATEPIRQISKFLHDVSDILESSEAFRHGMDYFSHTKNAHVMLERVGRPEPTTLACSTRACAVRSDCCSSR